MSCTMPDPITTDVAVIGGGIVGLGIAWEAQRTGRRVVVIDPAPGSGATFAAAGMLAPVSELHYQEEDLLELTLASAERWPGFAASLSGGSHAETGLRSTPTLVLGADAADRQALADLCEAQQRHGLETTRLGIREARAREPMLAPHLAAAYLVPRDHQVDPRAVAAAIAARLAEVAAARENRTRGGPSFTPAPSPCCTRIPMTPVPAWPACCWRTDARSARGKLCSPTGSAPQTWRVFQRAWPFHCGPCMGTSCGCACRKACGL